METGRELIHQPRCSVLGIHGTAPAAGLLCAAAAIFASGRRRFQSCEQIGDVRRVALEQEADQDVVVEPSRLLLADLSWSLTNQALARWIERFLPAQRGCQVPVKKAQSRRHAGGKGLPRAAQNLNRLQRVQGRRDHEQPQREG